jgi:hypothetical protein
MTQHTTTIGLGIRRTRCLLAALTLGASVTAATALAAPAVPQPADTAAIEAVQRLPRPTLRADTVPWLVPAGEHVLIDDFEAVPWPNPERWVQVLDLNGAATGGEYLWAPRNCHPAGGARALWAVGGGANGQGLACGQAYPDNAASSALLALDLTGKGGVQHLALSFDIWADAAPNEGLFVNYVMFNGQGATVERRTVYSATGRASAWARGVSLDLTDLHDRLDSTWRKDLRGQVAYLEFLFVSVPNQPDGEGIFLDNLFLDSEDAVVIVTPTTPNLTIGCTTGADCGTLTTRGFVDNRCDGRYQPGLDTPVRGARVDVSAGAVSLGTTLSKSGNAFFRVPLSDPISVQFAVPDGYMMCSNSAQTVALSAANFAPFGRKQVEFRITRRR